MEHIKIEQNSNVEVVDSNIIHKLAEEAQDCDASSNMTGNLQTTTAYEDDVNFLTTKFPGLSINATQGLYLRIADTAVQNILATNFGDGIGITKAQAQSLQHFNSKFAGNTDIETFNELSKFTNITEINYNNRFNGCTNLTSIDLKNITKISGKNGYERWNFENCIYLTNIGDASNVTYIGKSAFNSCPLQGVIDFSNVTVFGDSALWQARNPTVLADLSQCIIDPSKIVFIGNSAFFRCSSFSALSTINFSNLESVSPEGESSTLSETFDDCTQIQHIQSLGKITEIGNKFNEGCFQGCNNLLDVTLPETLTKVLYSAIGSRPNLRYVKILANSVPTYDLVDGFGHQMEYGIAFGEEYRQNDVTNTYEGSTYPIYVKDSLLSQYEAADGWKYVGPNRLRPLSQFATDFPNG